jgi:hypothetical protein
MGASVNFICLAHPADTNLGGVVSSSGRKYTISTLWGCLGHHINTTELLKWILKEGLYPAVEKTRFYLYTEVARDILVGTVVGLPFIMPNTTSLISIGHLSYKDRFQMN